MNHVIEAIANQEFTTARLHLRGLQETDADFIQQLTNTEGWLQFIGDRNTQSNQLAAEYITKLANDPKVNYWKVCLNYTSEPIGVVTLIKREYLEDCDIGFALLPEFSKKGYALEATKAVLDAVLNQNLADLILAVTRPENTDSIKLLEKLGMHLKETIKNKDEALNVYAINRALP